MKSLIFRTAAFLLCTRRVLAGYTYSKSVDITGADFYDEFSFYEGADPTHGRVFAPLFRRLVRLFMTDHISSVPTSIGGSLRNTISPMSQITPSSCAPTIQRILCHPILVENHSVSPPTDNFQPLLRCMLARFLITLFIITFVASTCITCQKDVGERLNHALLCFTYDKPHLEHGQPYGL